MQTDSFEKMRSEMPSFIFRDKVGAFGLNPRTMANLDSKGLGPKGRFRIGRKIVYDREALLEWLKNRRTEVEKRPVRAATLTGLKNL